MGRALIAIVAATLAATTAQAQTSQLARKNGWFDDYPRAKAEAKRTGKPMFLVFRCDP